MRIGSLFSGIGGLELGLERAGLGPVIWQAESDEYARRVLEKHWHGVKRYHDVRDIDASAERPDLICGGFPCQDISSAGKGAGLAGDRSGLWFEFARIVEELEPAWVVVENVASGARRWVDQVCANLGQLDYAAVPIPLSAQDVGAPHIRRRIFVVAYSERYALRNEPERRPEGWARGVQGQGKAEPVDASAAGITRAPTWPASPEICGMDDGISRRMDRLRCLGNAVVPQCAEIIGHMIAQTFSDSIR